MIVPEICMIKKKIQIELLKVAHVTLKDLFYRQTDSWLYRAFLRFLQTTLKGRVRWAVYRWLQPHNCTSTCYWILHTGLSIVKIKCTVLELLNTCQIPGISLNVFAIISKIGFCTLQHLSLLLTSHRFPASVSSPGNGSVQGEKTTTLNRTGDIDANETSKSSSVLNLI